MEASRSCRKATTGLLGTPLLIRTNHAGSNRGCTEMFGREGNRRWTICNVHTSVLTVAAPSSFSGGFAGETLSPILDEWKRLRLCPYSLQHCTNIQCQIYFFLLTHENSPVYMIGFDTFRQPWALRRRSHAVLYQASRE